MSKDELVCVFTGQPFEAEVVKARLEGSGMQGYSQMKEDEANRFQLAATAGVEFMAKGSLFGSVAWNNDLMSYNKGDFGDNFFHGPSFALGVKF